MKILQVDRIKEISNGVIYLNDNTYTRNSNICIYRNRCPKCNAPVELDEDQFLIEIGQCVQCETGSPLISSHTSINVYVNSEDICKQLAIKLHYLAPKTSKFKWRWDSVHYGYYFTWSYTPMERLLVQSRAKRK